MTTTRATRALILTLSCAAPAAAQAAQATVTGTGCAGGAGVPFQAIPQGLPTLGNAAYAVSVSGGPPGGMVLKFNAVGLAPAPLVLGGGCVLHLGPTSALQWIANGWSPWGPYQLGAAGGLVIPFPIPSSAALAGFRIDSQYFVFDPAAPNGFVISNAYTLILGH